MSYTNVFGGGTINPAQRTYISLAIAASVTLQWPIEQQIGGDNIAADILDVDASVVSLNVDFSDARQVSTGFTSLFSNVGANTFTVRDSTGGAIISPAPGEAWFVYLTDNSTAAGTWATFQLGATVSVASASALAGAGLRAITTTLNQSAPPTLTAVTPTNIVDGNRAQFFVWTGGVGTFNLPTPATVGSDWFFMVRNAGSGDLTISPTAGLVNDGPALVLAPTDSAIFVTDGTDFFTVGLGQALVNAFDFVEVDVAGTGDFVLAGVNLNRISYRLIGVLTGNRNIVVPTTVQEYWVDNQTTGAFQVFVKTAAQVSPPEVRQTNSRIFYCDGTDVQVGASTDLRSSGTFNAVFTGFAAPPALPNVDWEIINDRVYVELSFTTGTSNAVGFTITNVPAIIQPATQQEVYIGSAIDNGANIAGCTLLVGTGATWFFGAGQNNPGGGGWTAANAKGLGGSSFKIDYSLTL